MKKRILTIILGILCTAGMHGQSSDVPSLSQLTTPSPKATMVDRFGYYPTNLYTGLVDITIPIHTIEVKGIKIPIEFKYHASGLKYDDLPMEVGYGWTLMAGGTVSYSARAASAYLTKGEKGEPFIKEVKDIVKNDKTGSLYSDQLQLDYVINGSKSDYTIQGKYRDSEYDVYNFSFPEHSGQYYLLEDNKEFTVPVSTTYLYGSGYTPVARDEHGNEYQFGVRDSDGDIARNFTYYLTKVISADKGDTIHFSYQEINWGTTDKLVHRPVIEATYSFKDNMQGTTQSSIDGVTGITRKSFNTPILKEISHKGNRVEFQYSSTEIRSLEQIRIYQQGTLVKSVRLAKTDHAYLDAARFYGSDNKEIYSYGFEYNGKRPEGYMSIDYWGYCNGPSASSPHALYVPNFTLPNNRTIPGLNRSLNEAYMQKGMLTKIVYPTKGYTTFTYEPHRGQNGVLYGGLRIKEMNVYNESGNLQEKKWYKYGLNESGNGRAIRTVDPNDYCSQSYLLEAYWAPGFEGAITLLGERTRVDAYHAFPLSDYFQQGSTVVYSCVTEYMGTPAAPEGKTEYRFSDFMDEWYYGTMRGNRTEIPKWSNAWKCGKLVGKTVTDNSGKIVYSLSNTYEEINRRDYLNLRVLSYCNIYGPASGIKEIFSTHTDFSTATEGSLYDYYNYYITSGEYVVKESKEFNDGVYKTVRYKYNELGQIIEETLVNSEGNEQIVRKKYTCDFWKDAMSGSIYDKMYWKNIHSPALETSVYKGEALVGKTTNEYKDWGDFIALQNVKQLNYYEPRIKYQSYDKYGNPTVISKDGEFEEVSYIWGHQGQRVIAEIRGGSFDTLGPVLTDRVTSAVSPSSADMAIIEALRSNPSLEGSRITTYYYDSALNLKQLVMPNGTKTSYEYDSFGRLACVKDQNGKIIESYQYNYKQ